MADKKKTPDEVIEEAKSWVGKEAAPFTNPYPVEHESIRRYCSMVDDENPLFLDPEYGKKTRYGGTPLPPFAAFGLMATGGPLMGRHMKEGKEVGIPLIMPPAPGKSFINMAQEWEWYKPIMVGDTITTTCRLSSVEVKGIKIDPKTVWITDEMRVTNQKGELCCVYRNIVLAHRTPEQVAADTVAD